VKGLSARTLRALYNARNLMDSKFRSDPVNRATFKKILMQSSGLTHAMRLMNQTSVLGRYLWVFRKIVGQMQHDLFHVYTVDQHILMVLRNVRRFFIVEHAHEYPFCSQLASGWDKPWILYVAALFHDIAKGRGGDHSELGAMEVRRFCKQHDIGREDAQLIELIVVNHLTMSHVAQKSDLSDPDVISAFAKRVGNERNLTALYLLTVADIRGTSPKVWNAWKGKLLEDLYRLTLRTLGGRAPDPDAEVESRKREALVNLALYALPFEAHKALWNTLDVGYFMRHDAADIAWHTRQISRHVGQGKSIVRARLSPLGEGLQVLVYTPDQPDLFARICGYFDQGGFSILDARIHTANNGYALDTFQVIAASMPDHYQEFTSMIESELARTITVGGPLPPPSRGRVSRRVKSFPITPRVTLRPDEKAQRWLLNISASDRVGLLYCVARVLAKHHINLQLAKVATLGERVDDTFLIQGAELQHNRAQIEIETELLEALS
jgi:[protein-PII] uridylyltransferase